MTDDAVTASPQFPLRLLAPLLALLLLPGPPASARAAVVQDGGAAPAQKAAEPQELPPPASDEPAGPPDPVPAQDATPTTEPPAGSTSAPTTTPAPAQDPAPTTGDEALSSTGLVGKTIPELRASVAAVETALQVDAVLTGDQRGVVQTLLAEARAALDTAEADLQRSAGFDKAREEAPARLAAIQDELKVVKEPPETPPAEATLRELEEALDVANALLKQRQSELTDLEAERSHRAERRAALPTLIAEARAKLGEAKAPETQGDPALLAEARRLQGEALRRRDQARVSAHEAELSSYEARGDLLSARLDIAPRRVQRARTAVDQLTTRIGDLRRREAELAAKEAARARFAAAAAHPVAAEIAQRNEGLARRRLQLADRLELLNADYTQVEELRQSVTDKRSRVEDKVEITGFTDSIALVLRKHAAELPPVRTWRRSLADYQDEMARVQAEQLDMQDELQDRRTLGDRVVDQYMERVDPALPEAELEAVREAITVALDANTKLLKDLNDDIDRVFARLSDLDASGTLLVRDLEAYTDYIQENVLWVPSAHVLGLQDVEAGGSAVRWLLRSARWSDAFDAVVAYATRSPGVLGAGVLLVLLLFSGRRALRKTVRAQSDAIARQRVPSYTPTLVALLDLAVGAAAWPVTLWSAGWYLAGAPNAPEVLVALGGALEELAVPAFPLSLMRRAALPSGLAEVHLRWPKPVLDSLRRLVPSAAGPLLAAVFVVEFFALLPSEEFEESIGRVGLIAAMLLLALLARRLLRPTGPVMEAVAERFTGGALWIIRYPVGLLAVGVPVVLAIGAIAGYVYTATEAEGRLFATIALVLVVLFVRGVILRWHFIAQRRVRLEQARKRREAREAEAPPETLAAASESGTVEEPEVFDMNLVDSQTRTLIDMVSLLFLLLGLGVVWARVLPAMGLLGRNELYEVLHTTVGADGAVAETVVAITLAEVLQAIVTIVVMVVSMRNLPGLLELWVLRRMDVAPGISYAATTLTRYAVVLAGVVTASTFLGLTWDKVQWLVAAVSVGLGFGLQEIFANFVSGLIILFERPVRVGDIVTVGGVEGVVTKLHIRATTIRDWDRRELLVPNREFITGQLINWTLTDPITRLVFPIGVAYGSPTDETTKILMKVAKDHPLCLEDPAPSVVFRSFGDSALNFDLRVFIGNRDLWPKIVHEVNTNIEAALREADITIPFPQRDVHVRTYGPGGKSGFERSALEGAAAD